MIQVVRVFCDGEGFGELTVLAFEQVNQTFMLWQSQGTFSHS